MNYGVLPDLQLHALVPQSFTASSGGRTGFALGDIERGIKYRLITPERGGLVPTGCRVLAGRDADGEPEAWLQYLARAGLPVALAAKGI